MVAAALVLLARWSFWSSTRIMPQVTMVVTKTELASGGGGTVTFSKVNGPIQGTITLTFTDKTAVKTLDPGDNVLFNFTKA